MTGPTPYSCLPDRAYWRRAVAAPAVTDVDPVDPPPFQIAPADLVMTAGSCFAQHIARYLQQSGFNALLTETAHPMIQPEDAAAFNYGTFTARYGNIYVARQLVQLFLRAYEQFTPDEDIWTEADGCLIDPFRPQIQPGGFASRREYDLDRQQHFAAVRKGFETLDIFVFTLGLTEGWVSRQDGAVFPLCPGVAGGRFEPERHAFHNFTVDEIVADMGRFIGLLRGVNPRARVVLTISPVPLIATASGKHVLTATTWSKSVLRVAAGMLEASFPNVSYFPSYEVILGPQAGNGWLASDLRSVREEGVAQVMRLFFRHFTDTEPRFDATPEPQIADRATEDMAELVKLVCEEEALDRGD
ncbi:MAG: GSCFA domain-containing protein [Paracoccaceae bacterium]